MAENRFVCDYALRGTSACKKCKQKIDKGAPRIGKVTANPFSDDGGDMKVWYHIACIFETFKRARATTKTIETPDDIEGWEKFEDEEKDKVLEILKKMPERGGSKKTPAPAAPSKPKAPKTEERPKKEKKEKISKNDDSDTDIEADNDEPKISPKKSDDSSGASADPNAKDNSFRAFRALCQQIAEESSHNKKTEIIRKFFADGTDGEGFNGDLYLFVKLLIPGVVKRVYNINSKQLVKLYSEIFGTNLEEMTEDLEQGDVSETIRKFFAQSSDVAPSEKSRLTIHQVDHYLQKLSEVTKEEDQLKVLRDVAKRSTVNDLKAFISLVKHDLRINAQAKPVLEALAPGAYQAFQASRNLRNVVDRARNQSDRPGMSKELSVHLTVMTAVLPMLAEACRSVEQAMARCPQGMLSEIKYDGERVQVHKKGDKFTCYSRSLKPVQAHKVDHLEEYLPKAFPRGDELIIDSEVLLIDTNTGKPLPFGTLGSHKKGAFQDANVCLFVFDCIHYNGKNLLNTPIKERRRILEENMVEVPNRIMLSETQFIDDADVLSASIQRAIDEGLEGLVLKPIESVYEPGKRHWLKVKKDYLADGAMADSADLVVLGAYYGTGNKGGIMSVFLMGAWDENKRCWCTVTKVGNGFDDATRAQLQTELQVVKISKNADKVPSWLRVSKGLIPDFVVKDPKEAPVWEVTGAEFSKSDSHTAGGISIRFPRVTRVRDDKTWKEATDVARLKVLSDNSSRNADNRSPAKRNTDSSPLKRNTDSSSPLKRKAGGGRDEGVSPNKQKNLTSFFSPKKEARGSSSSKEAGGSSGSKGAKNPACTLPSIFPGCNIFISDKIDNNQLLKRYAVAYDADVVDDEMLAEATHVVCDSSEEASQLKKQIKSKAAVVSSKWLLDSVRRKRKLPVDDYLEKDD